MEFEWDEAKDAACLAARGFDFAFTLGVFRDPDRVITRDDRFDYGEARYRAAGYIEGRLFIVVFTRRGERIRIISARKANRKEVARHGNPARQA
ncbi:BrnT family toxin [Roseomonas sp. JC162]|uniref:BrnT family toxin n=1 Tax=Neoroseomonas marina TaxID=1232220 RepID=A0A848E8M5_9PROT|nr:BrnT family toxin [Neoroseomonas marina]